MIYLDANLFIYAYYKSKKGKNLTPRIQWMKEEGINQIFTFPNKFK